nr:hypothetical protein [Actinomycetota bacterium]
MTDIEDELHRLLTNRAAEVDPRLTGAGIRDLADHRRRQRGRAVALPAAGTVLAAALLLTPFVLVHQGNSAPRRPAVIVPAASDTPSSKPPTPAPSSSPPLAVPSRAVTSPSSQPSGPLA